MRAASIRRGRFVLVAAVLLLTLLVSSLALASDGTGGFTATPLTPEGSPASATKPPNDGVSAQRSSIDPNDYELVSVIVTLDGSVNPDALAAIAGGEVINRYDKVFNGASLVLAGERVDTLAALPGVTAVYLDTLQQPDTEASPQFIGAPAAWNALGGQSNAGEGVVVGILDTGIWPEHPSFSDPDPSGKAYAAPAARPARCDFGNTVFNRKDAPFTCNNKLIGAYNMLNTYKVLVGLEPTEFDSARDDDGHGTHTASTAAGNGGVAAKLFGVPYGTASGVAPRAQIIAYRVCAAQGCFNSDSVAAVNQAIHDGVDVINFSISGGENPYSDAVEQAFAMAYTNGVFVAASAGNSGPTPDTVGHRGPWTMTVAASTSNRHFMSTLTVTANNGDKLTIEGVTITDGITTPTQLVKGSPLDCNEPAQRRQYRNKIVICERGTIARVLKGYNVLQGNAAGMVLFNPALQGLSTDNHYLPSIHIEYPDGDALLDFVDTHSGVRATFTAGVATTVDGDVMGAFSSRGGPGQKLGISKPDITAPGVQILAGNTPLPSSAEAGPQGELFMAIQGTSMSSPHVAGAAALVAAQRPDWTPGQIKSALMTTAQTNVAKEDGSTPATPFDTGSGRVDLTRAGWAPLTFDESVANYIAYEDNLWDANYPSLYVPNLSGSLTVNRTVEDQTGKKSTWTFSVSAPPDLQVTVPRRLNLRANDSATFSITVSAPTVPNGEVRHATLTMQSDQGATLTFPITVVRGQAPITVEKECAPDVIRLREATDCTVTITNTGFEDAPFSLVDRLPSPLRVLPWTVEDGVRYRNTVEANGVLQGAVPPDVRVEVDPDVAGYLPLSLFGIPPFAGAGDETIINYTIPPFLYGGEVYTRLGVVSNGYVVVGGGGVDDIDFFNTDLPHPAPPNNVLAVFWTDLNPVNVPAEGGIRVGILTDGTDDWLVADWQDVPNWSDPSETNSFQVWIRLLNPSNPVEDITYSYGEVTGGDLGFLTIGAENKFGSRGDTVHLDGEGEAIPGPDLGVRVSTDEPSPGESHTISFSARGNRIGSWMNCANLTSPLFPGTAMDCAIVEVTSRK